MSGIEYSQAILLWRDTAAGAWRAYSRHLFVKGLRDAAKRVPNLRQDYLFLIQFARS